MSAITDAERLACIRARLHRNELPQRDDRHRLYGGYGEDQHCDCCGRTIARCEAVLDVESSQQGTRTLSMHVKCFDLWRQEAAAPPPRLARTGSD